MESVIVWIRFWIVLSLVLVSIWEKRKENAKIIPNSPPCLSTLPIFSIDAIRISICPPPSAQLSNDENPFASFVRPLSRRPLCKLLVITRNAIIIFFAYYPRLSLTLVIDIFESSFAAFARKGGRFSTTLSNVDSALEPRRYPLRGRRRTPPRNIDDARNSSSSGVEVYF